MDPTIAINTNALIKEPSIFSEMESSACSHGKKDALKRTVFPTRSTAQQEQKKSTTYYEDEGVCIRGLKHIHVPFPDNRLKLYKPRLSYCCRLDLGFLQRKRSTACKWTLVGPPW